MAEDNSASSHTPGSPPRFPRWVYLAGSALIALVPPLIGLLGGGEAIKAFFFGVYDRLRLIQPFNFIPTYLGEFLACDHRADIGTNCSALRFVNPLRLVGALLSTAGDIIQHSDGPAMLLMLMALVVGYFVSLGLLKRLFNTGETHLGLAVAAAAATPFAASFAALLLQWVAMLLSLFVAYMIAALLWAAGFIHWGWSTYKEAREVGERAHTLERIHQAALGLVNGKQPPKT